MRAKPGRVQAARRVTSSPSARKARRSPVGRVSSRTPPAVRSSRQPAPSSPVPEMVPLARRSPGRSGHPLLAWWATIWATVQYMPRNAARLTRTGARPRRRISALASHASTVTSMPPAASFAAEARCGGAGGSSAGRPAEQRKGARASRVTTQGETLVAKLFDRNGPRGCASQAWRSRADQSFTRQSPAMRSSASSIGMGRPGRLPAPTQAPTSTS